MLIFFNSFLTSLLWWDRRGWNIELTLVPSLQIRPRKYSAEIFVWHYFGKDDRVWWDSKQNEWLSRSRRSKGFCKKVVQKNICAGVSFLIKLDAIDLQLYLKRASSTGSLRIPFLQNTIRRLLLIIALSIVVKGKFTNETVNHDT